MTTDLTPLIAQAEAELEVALRGASLCSVSRDPRQGSTDVKFKEGRWYTLRDLQRQLDAGKDLPAALVEVAGEQSRRTPAGDAWTTYRAGAAVALADVARQCGIVDDAV